MRPSTRVLSSFDAACASRASAPARRDRRSPAPGPASALLALCAVLLLHTPPATAAPAERDAVLAVVDALFTAMRDKDAQQLRNAFMPEARLGTEGVDDWISAVTTSTAMLDEVTYRETVLVDDGLAVAWTPYTIYIDGALHHCGVDSFVMQRSEGAWKILQLDDTRRSDDCPDPRGVNSGSTAEEENHSR